MPKDKFRRERERRIVAAIQFENVYRRSLRRHPLPYQLERINKSVKPDLPDKSFDCDCGQEIIATGESRNNREKISCPKCGEVFKLNPEYATNKYGNYRY